MPIPFQCPHCGLEIQVAEQFAGSSGSCKQCGQPIQIPSLPGGAPAGMPAMDGIACPKCGSPHTGPGDWPWYLGTLGAMFVSARACNQCGHEFDARKPHEDFRQRKKRLALIINGLGGLGIIIVISLVTWFAFVTLK